MFKKVITIIILLSKITLSFSQETDAYSNDIEEKIKRVENSLIGWVVVDKDTAWTIEERMKFYGINGLSIAVINDFKIEWAKGYGVSDKEQNKSVTTKTLFQAASISKSFNATAILKLYQDGKVDLYKDINAYLTSWKFPYNEKTNGKTINLYNILSHTAGLSVHGFMGYKRETTLPSVVQILDGKKPANNKPVRSLHPPELKFEYSGGGTIISQLLLSDVTKQPYEQYLQSNILNPLNMTNSCFMQPPTEDIINNVATGYFENGKQVDGKFNVYPELAAAGLWTTPSDLCKYIIETQLSYLGKSDKVLSQGYTKLRLKTVTENIEPNCDLILGGFIIKGESENYFFHAGGNAGFTSLYFGSLKTGKGIALMCNGNGSIQILKEITNSVAKIYNWVDFPLLPINEIIINLNEETASKYIGKYKTPEGDCKIVKKNNDLYIKLEDELYKMYFINATDFFVKEKWKKFYTIETDNKGKTTGQIVLKK